MRIYRIQSRDFLVAGGQYTFIYVHFQLQLPDIEA
jgi:hypothetical protein